MSKTLEETKAHIIELSKQHNLNEETINSILENIKTDEKGLVSDSDFYLIDIDFYDMLAARDQTLCNLEIAKRIREKRKKSRVIRELIATIENEINSSSCTVYVCKDGQQISTDVGYVKEWFDEYKQVLKDRYKESKY